MFLLTPQDVDITSIQHPKQPKRIPVLSYQDRTFRLLTLFQAHQDSEAHAAWRELVEKQKKACVLLEEPHRFSLWRLVNIDKSLLAPIAPAAYRKAGMLLLQSLRGDTVQLLGAKQAGLFDEALAQAIPEQMKKAGGLSTLLRTNPLTQVLPRWDEDDLSILLLELSRLGSRFFGQAKFAARTLAALNVLPGNDKAVFMSWLQLSLLAEPWGV
ncbi:MAG: hypothetical protein WBG63_15565 [Phormidesmis sp.]